MKNIYKLMAFTLIPLFLASSFLSCSDDKEIDEWTKTYVYLQSENYLKGYNIFNLEHSGLGLSGEVSLKFNVKTQKPAPVDIIVNLDIESEDIDKDLFAISSNKVTIKAGETISEDVIVSVNDFSSIADNKEAKEYSFKIIIKEIINNDEEITVSDLLDVIECSIKKGMFINLDATATTIEGTPLDKSSWTAEANITYQPAYSASNAIDNNNSTVWFAQAYASTPILTVNMGSREELKGFRITPNYTAFGKTYAIKKIEVLISDDGNKWTSQGISALFSVPSGSIDDPDYKVIKFHEAVKTTYFRFVLVENHTSYAGIAEIDAIK